MKLNIPENFYKEEVRDDFTIPSEMKHCGAAQLEVLAQLDDICRKYGLHYFALYGTLLGAVRDKGFIPWDDDLDIGMLRSDLITLERIAPQVFPDDLHMVTYRSLKGFDSLLPRVTNCLNHLGSPETIKERMKKYHGCPYVVGLDIFPLDYVPASEDERDLQLNLLKILETCRLAWLADDVSISNRRYLTVQVEQTFNVVIDEHSSSEEINCQLLKLEDAVCAMYGPADSDEVAITFLQLNLDRRFPAKAFTNYIMQPFEFTEIPVPLGYHEFLTAYYGDYMVKINEPSSHEYPFYKSQKAVLEQAGIFIDYDHMNIL